MVKSIRSLDNFITELFDWCLLQLILDSDIPWERTFDFFFVIWFTLTFFNISLYLRFLFWSWLVTFFFSRFFGWFLIFLGLWILYLSLLSSFLIFSIIFFILNFLFFFIHFTGKIRNGDLSISLSSIGVGRTIIFYKALYLNWLSILYS